MDTRHDCPVCDGDCFALDVVDFNKSCEEARGTFLPLSGVPVYYFLCEECQFCFAPEFSRWGMREFEDRIYNEEYVRVDPDYLDGRPRANAEGLLAMFGDRGREIRHLDYGGGDGLLSRVLKEARWHSTSWDPFGNRDVSLPRLGKFDLITAFEVFEHVPDVRALAANLSSLLADENGMVLFSTMLSDTHINARQRITWWYASPRNGHVSLFSSKSLILLGARERFSYGSMSSGMHAYWRQVPPWARHVIYPDGG